MMTPELEKLKTLIENVNTQIQEWQKNLGELLRACTHHIVQNRESAICDVCKKDFGCFCPDSPDNLCYYNSISGENNKRMVELENGTLVKLPASHKHEDECDDWCIFCGHPSERK